MNPETTELQQLVVAIHALQQTVERLVRLSEERTQREAERVMADSAPPDQEPQQAKEQELKPVDWLRISGRKRLMAWRDLAAFVESLVVRYNMEALVRPCWWRHAEAIEELTALWHVRQDSYRDGASLQSAMSWMDNFNKSRERLRVMFTACSDYHVGPNPRPWMSNADRAAFYKGVSQDCAVVEGVSWE